MDIGGAMMNQVIGSRNKVAQNTSSPVIEGKLFARGLSDQVLNGIIEEANKGKEEFDAANKAASGNTTPPEGNESSPEAKAEANKKFAQFFEKVCLVPHVELIDDDNSKWEDDPYKKNYLAA